MSRPRAPKKPGPSPTNTESPTRIDRKRTSVVAPETGLKVDMETVSDGNYRGLSLSFEEFVPGDGDVLPFAPRRKPRG